MTQSYSYLSVSLFFLALSGASLFAAGRHRKIGFIAGLFYMCVLPLYIPFEGEYWTPKRAGEWILGIEDALFLFALGSMPWAVVTSLLRERLTTDLQWLTFLWRYGWLAFLGFGTFLSLWVIGWPAIWASILAQVLISTLVLVLRRDLWLLAVIGFVVWTPLYLLILKATYSLWPDFTTVWNHDNFWGATVFGLPIGEILWVSSGSWGYSVAIGYTVSAQLRTAPARNSTSPR